MKSMEADRTKKVTESESESATRTYTGVDTTMLEWMASNTPEQRLQILQNNVAAIIKARNVRRRS